MSRKVVIAAMLATATFALAAPALADTRAGVDAWSRGDFAGAVRTWQAEAARGDADAMFDLGQAYAAGKGVKQDLAMAEQLYGKAAALGHLQASDNYGQLLFHRGARAQALPYIRAAADRGDPRAQYLLGLAHFNGDMVPKDYVRAYALVSLARQGGLAQATPALQQMDKYVSLADRQQAIAMAQELQSEAEATRARQMAAVDLGAQIPGATPPTVIRRPVTPSSSVPVVAATETATSIESPGGGYQGAGTQGGGTGADYTPTPPEPVAEAAAPAPRPVRVRPAPVRPPVERPAPAPRLAAGGAWRIQFGAFGVPGNADALWRKLAGRPEVAGHPRINAHSGSVIRLQAGGYSEAGAHAACARLSASGQTCVPARN